MADYRSGCLLDGGDTLCSWSTNLDRLGSKIRSVSNFLGNRKKKAAQGIDKLFLQDYVACHAPDHTSHALNACCPTGDGWIHCCVEQKGLWMRSISHKLVTDDSQAILAALGLFARSHLATFNACNPVQAKLHELRIGRALCPICRARLEQLGIQGRSDAELLHWNADA